MSHIYMPSSHLPRAPCDIFVYDFPCDFGGIVGGYGLRHKNCVHIVYGHRAISSLGPRGQSPQPTHGNRTEPVRGLCNATYDISTGYGLTTCFQICKSAR